MKRVDYWLLGAFAALAATAAALARSYPPSTGSGQAIGLGWADLVFKLGLSVVFGLAITRAYTWRRRWALALLLGAVWFVMIAGAAHIPASWLGTAYLGCLVLIVGAFVLDLAWRHDDKKPGWTDGPGDSSLMK